MIAQLIEQLGLSVSSVVRPEVGLILDTEGRKQNVFYVAEALGSPHIVAQEEFVGPYRIASVIGLGGLITTGDMFALIWILGVTACTLLGIAFSSVPRTGRSAPAVVSRQPSISS